MNNVTVSERAREAAADLEALLRGYKQGLRELEIRDGRNDDHPFVQLCAKLVAQTREECAAIAESAFDDRGNSRSGHYSEMDWTDGYRDATRAAAAAIRQKGQP